MRHGFLAALLLFYSSLALALEPRTAHTFKLADGESAPEVDLADLAWLSGRWEGEAFGKTFEAVWNPPSAGSMVGLFKLIDGDSVDFYELLTIGRIDGLLALRVKHFSSEFVAWEEKDDFIEFRFIGLDADAIHFGGMSFYRRGPDTFDGYILFRRGDELAEERLVYRRVP